LTSYGLALHCCPFSTCLSYSDFPLYLPRKGLHDGFFLTSFEDGIVSVAIFFFFPIAPFLSNLCDSVSTRPSYLVDSRLTSTRLSVEDHAIVARLTVSICPCSPFVPQCFFFRKISFALFEGVSPRMRLLGHLASASDGSLCPEVSSLVFSSLLFIVWCRSLFPSVRLSGALLSSNSCASLSALAPL